MSRASSFEAESEISSRSHKLAPDCRNSEWDYADCAGHNRVAIGLQVRGAMGDGSKIRLASVRRRLAIRIISGIGLKTGLLEKDKKRERKRNDGFLYGWQGFHSVSFYS